MKYQQLYNDSKFEVWIVEDVSNKTRTIHEQRGKKDKVFRCQLINRIEKKDNIFYCLKSEIESYKKYISEDWNDVWNILERGNEKFKNDVYTKNYNIADILKIIYYQVEQKKKGENKMEFRTLYDLFDKIMNDTATKEETNLYFDELNMYENKDLIHQGMLRNWSRNKHKELVKEITQ